jgi:hypothetical protein
MKLLFETSETNFDQELLEGVEKKYKIKGIFSSPGKLNKNGRIYPMNIWESEVAKYQDVLKNGHPNALMELEHPPRSNVDMMEAVAKMEKLWIENGYVMGEAVLLDNPKANQLKTLIDNGIKMSVSSRGLGSIKGGLVESFKLITFDIIANLGQSDYNAEMYGIREGVLQDKEFIMTESGEIREVKIVKEEVIPEQEPIVENIEEIKADETPEEKVVEPEIDKEKLSEEILNKFKTIFSSTKISGIDNNVNESLMSDISDISKLLEIMPKSKCDLKNLQPARDYIKELIKNINSGITVISVDEKGKRKISNLPK